MLLANETVAQSMSSAPFLYRVHEKPDPAKMEALEKTLRAVGVVVPTVFYIVWGVMEIVSLPIAK